ncbi:6681_t:CDS:2 [Funneliformis caledonium]|uniref:6681_t:CDS:1 n=1 Tax=Funneliformis caledonium TaxID=1117310 RepID=A0A9N9N4E9_9GLOM|nr:6681_t:CDS:2 [Funneliformis caledonium]
MPNDSKLNVKLTFESERNLVNRIIIQTIQARLKNSEEQDRQARRGHKNTCAREVATSQKEGSETDLDHPDNERLVIIKDIS